MSRNMAKTLNFRRKLKGKMSVQITYVSAFFWAKCWYRIYNSERLPLSLNKKLNQDLTASKDDNREVACPICLSLASWSFSQTILNTHSADLYICPSCDYLFAVNPHWLKQAYHRVINTMDTGCMARLIHLRNETALPIYLMTEDTGSWIDYGGGHGGYCRLMRDVGFDFYWNDPMAENLFAAGFQEPSGIKFAGVTCFECFEHFTDPRNEIKKNAGTRAPYHIQHGVEASACSGSGGLALLWMGAWSTRGFSHPKITSSVRGDFWASTCLWRILSTCIPSPGRSGYTFGYADSAQEAATDRLDSFQNEKSI